jgi:Family of unknown function (DUF6326)
MMQAKTNTASVLEDVKAPVQLRLAVLWTSFMFVYAYADILGFYLPGTIEDILAGTVWQFEISQTWAVGALALSLVPILMVFLSLVLPARANRMTNIVVASLYAIVSVGNAIGESWVYYYGLVALAEIVALALIIRYAWKWPRTQPQQ